MYQIKWTDKARTEAAAEGFELAEFSLIPDEAAVDRIKKHLNPEHYTVEAV